MANSRKTSLSPGPDEGMARLLSCEENFPGSCSALDIAFSSGSNFDVCTRSFHRRNCALRVKREETRVELDRENNTQTARSNATSRRELFCSHSPSPRRFECGFRGKLELKPTVTLEHQARPKNNTPVLLTPRSRGLHRSIEISWRMRCAEKKHHCHEVSLYPKCVEASRLLVTGT